jgi:hypothetical protein
MRDGPGPAAVGEQAVDELPDSWQVGEEVDGEHEDGGGGHGRAEHHLPGAERATEDARAAAGDEVGEALPDVELGVDSSEQRAVVLQLMQLFR